MLDVQVDQDMGYHRASPGIGPWHSDITFNLRIRTLDTSPSPSIGLQRSFSGLRLIVRDVSKTKNL